MASQITLEQAVAELQRIYGDRMENGYEDGVDAMTATLEENFSIPKHEAKQLVQDLIAAHIIRFQGTADSLPASQNQAASIPLVDGFWYL